MVGYIRMTAVSLWLGCVAISLGQTKIDLPTQTRRVDFSTAISTKPIKAASVLPSACSTNEVFLWTNTATPSLLTCSATNVWTQLNGGGTSGGGSGTVGSADSTLTVTTDTQLNQTMLAVNPAAVAVLASNNDLTGDNSVNLSYSSVMLPNSGVATLTNRLLAIDTSGNATLFTTGSTTKAIGLAVSGTGTSGNVRACVLGFCTCEFDGATTANHYAVPSASTDGQCHDGGATLPSGQVLGTVLSTNGGAGPYLMLFQPSGGAGGTSGGSSITQEEVKQFELSNNAGSVFTPPGMFIPSGAIGVGTTTRGLPNLTEVYFAKGAPADTSKVIFQLTLPGWMTGTIKLRVYTETNSGTPGAVKYGLETACLANGGAWTTPAFNPEQALVTQSIASNGLLYFDDFTLNAASLTGCSAGKYMLARFRRISTDAGDTLNGDVDITQWRFTIQ